MMNKAISLFWRIPAPVFGISIALIFSGGLIWVIERASDFGPQALPIFHGGQMVKMRAFDAKGMVVGVRCPYLKYGDQCTYSVRFSAIQMRTNVRLLGSDGPIDVVPVALVRGIREFELEAAR